jgi:glucokinase
MNKKNTIPQLLLVGDIGGTKTFLRLENTQTEQSIFENCYSTLSFPSLSALVQRFLDEVALKLGEKPTLEQAVFAVPGPVIDNICVPPLLGWTINGKQLETLLAIKKVFLINDFEAISYGILRLPTSERYSLQTGQPRKNAIIGVIGAGTSIGYSFLLDQEPNYQVSPSEGGHADFTPRSELEFQLSQYLRKKFNRKHIPVLQIISGLGIVAIYQFLRDDHFCSESPNIAQVIKNWEQSQIKSKNALIDPAETIANAAINKQDCLCEKTMEIFVEAYGAEAGNFALRLLPYGGLFVAGGIAGKILPLLQTGSFINAFIGERPLSALLEKIPVNVVLNPQVGLLGASLYAIFQKE